MQRDHILQTARRLTLDHGVVPSLNSVAEAANVSKGGLTHHFRSRAALVAGLARGAIEQVDAAMRAAAAAGTVAETWIRLSLPDNEERELLQALVAAYRPADPELVALLPYARDAIERWETMIATEVGSVMQARVIRLVGDALVANALSGIDPLPPGTDVDELVGYLVADRSEESDRE